MNMDEISPISSFIYGKKIEEQKLEKKTSHVQRGTIFSQDHIDGEQLNEDVDINSFKMLKVIGRGTFGKVLLVEHKKSNQLFAMKSIKKDILIDQEQIENTLLEKQILQTIKHPFLVRLAYCFQTDDRIYFVLPFLRGGELFQHLRKFRIFDEEK